MWFPSNDSKFKEPGFLSFKSECEAWIERIHGVNPKTLSVDLHQLRECYEEGDQPIDVAISFNPTPRDHGYY